MKNLFFKIPSVIWIIFSLAFLMRFWGIWYGLPLQLNIDEPAMISTVLHLRYNLNPEHFDWPHLYYYINAGFYVVFAVLRKFLDTFFQLPDYWYSSVPFFFVSRLVSVILGSLTVPVIYFLAKEIFKKEKIAIVSALLLAILPIHVLESHFAKTDVAQTFFTSIALIFIWRVYRYGDRKYFLLSGILIGLSTSIKYGGVLLFFPLLLSYLIRNPYKKWINIVAVKNFLIAGIASVVTFFIGTPFALLDYRRFLSNERAVGALWQIKNVGSIDLEKYPLELWNTFALMYRENLGFGIWFVFTILIILFLFFNKRSKEYIFLLLPTIIFSFYISYFERSPSHYFLFLVPFYIPAIVNFMYEVWGCCVKHVSSRKLWLWVFFAIAIAPSIYSTVRSDYLFGRRDTRNYAFEWVKSNLKEDKDFLYVVGEELETIPFKKDETIRVKKIDRSTMNEATPFYIVVGVEGVAKESITLGEQDPENLSGNSEPILKYSDLVFYVDDSNRLGPPIYIFRVNKIDFNE